MESILKQLLSRIVAVGCDGTAVNTGVRNGVIRLLEEEVGSPLQWLVCQFHANELPLRHLLQHLDGKTTGPRGFSGPIGKQLENCEVLPVVPFTQIDSNLPVNMEVGWSDLSTDQQYLMEISQAISKGHCPPDLAKKNPGKLSHARWLTLANRVLRLYVATNEPSENLKTLVLYIMRVYAPMWFRIKLEPLCTSGAKHLFNMIYLSRYLTAELKAVVDPVIQRNGYFGHPENILIAMLADENPTMRELAYRRVLKIRNLKRTNSPEIRIFTIPNLNFDAADYSQLIDWASVKLYEPPLTFNIHNIEELVKNGSFERGKFDDFPCHTQAVERMVKVVTESSAAVCGEDSRDGFIRATIKSRASMPSFNTKSEYRAK